MQLLLEEQNGPFIHLRQQQQRVRVTLTSSSSCYVIIVVYWYKCLFKYAIIVSKFARGFVSIQNEVEKVVK